LRASEIFSRVATETNGQWRYVEVDASEIRATGAPSLARPGSFIPLAFCQLVLVGRLQPTATLGARESAQSFFSGESVEVR